MATGNQREPGGGHEKRGHRGTGIIDRTARGAVHRSVFLHCTAKEKGTGVFFRGRGGGRMWIIPKWPCLERRAAVPRPNRADEAGSIYQCANRGNARQTIFHKPEDYDGVSCGCWARDLNATRSSCLRLRSCPTIGTSSCDPPRTGEWAACCAGRPPRTPTLSLALSHFGTGTLVSGPLQEFSRCR